MPVTPTAFNHSGHPLYGKRSGAPGRPSTPTAFNSPGHPMYGSTVGRHAAMRPGDTRQALANFSAAYGVNFGADPTAYSQQSPSQAPSLRGWGAVSRPQGHMQGVQQPSGLGGGYTNPLLSILMGRR